MMDSKSINTSDGDGHWKMRLLNAVDYINDLFFACSQACHATFLSQCLPETSTVRGTIICPVINGEQVRLCIQEDSKAPPLILLDLPLNTLAFSSLIQYGLIRIVLECSCDSARSKEPLLSMPKWVMYCNGRKMGFARRREVTWQDAWLLEMMQGVSTGAGFLPVKGSGGYKYLRGQFKQVAGSNESEAYHLLDPSECFGQDLSVFFLRN